MKSRKGEPAAGTRPFTRSKGHDHTAIDPSLAKIVEDCVDVFELRLVNMGLDLALYGELDGFSEILARPDNRAADGDALQHDIEDGRRKVARRQSVERDGA